MTGYKAWGGPPRTLRDNALDGTVVPCAALGSLPFNPQETMAVLRNLRLTYGDRLWKRYGFVDAFNPQTGWVNQDVLSIDVGISIAQIENLRTGLIWRLFMQAPEVQLSLRKAGFLSTSRDFCDGQAERFLAAATKAWSFLQANPASLDLQLTALIAAKHLGLVTGYETLASARALLAQPFVSTDGTAIAQYAAGLITLRQDVPALRTEATEHLARIDWSSLSANAPALGAASRLAVFLQIANGSMPATAWAELSRAVTPLGPVHVLAPFDPAGALLPGLWLDERAILSGASAAQLAYASLTVRPAPSSPLLTVLQLDQFPQEALAQTVPVDTTSSVAAAALVITAANVLENDCVRRAFQLDPLVQAGRSAIPEFGEAAFGPNTSIIAQRELAGSPVLPPARQAVATDSSLPREKWDWHTVKGLEYLDSEADIRPGDAPLEFRFAFTWDEAALRLHMEVVDAPADYNVPKDRNRVVELFIDPDSDGLIWIGPKDYQFTYRVGIGARELFNHVANTAQIQETEHGFSVEAVIPWTSLGLTPKPGLEFGVSPAVMSEGLHEWEATVKLNWSYAVQRAGVYRLGRLHLQ